MRTIRTKVYSFTELSSEAREVALNDFRDINTNYDDWDTYELEQMVEKLSEIGFENATIQYSGFWSQGNGLSFDADINLLKFATTKNEKRVANLIDNGIIEGFGIYKNSYSNHYSHEKTRYTDYILCNGSNINLVLEKFTNDIESLRLDLCKQYYRQLEESYNDLQSDKQVEETILANEYEFLSNGKQY